MCIPIFISSPYIFLNWKCIVYFGKEGEQDVIFVFLLVFLRVFALAFLFLIYLFFYFMPSTPYTLPGRWAEKEGRLPLIFFTPSAPLCLTQPTFPPRFDPVLTLCPQAFLPFLFRALPTCNASRRILPGVTRWCSLLGVWDRCERLGSLPSPGLMRDRHLFAGRVNVNGGAAICAVAGGDTYDVTTLYTC